MTKEEYRRYLQSPEWKEKRSRTIKSAAGKCADCLAERRILGNGSGYIVSSACDVHHLTYERVGGEYPEDLIALCERHHQMRHSLEPTKSAMRRDLSYLSIDNNAGDEWVPDLSVRELTLAEMLGVRAHEIPGPSSLDPEDWTT
jgi:hypothetical protein